MIWIIIIVVIKVNEKVFAIFYAMWEEVIANMQMGCLH